MISGSTHSVYLDGPVRLNSRHIGNLLEEKGLSWKAYAEDYPGNCFLGAARGRYVRKHVPFLSFTSVQSDPSECAKVVNASQFDQDYRSGNLPTFSFYSPNLDHDGHDTGAEFADHWLSQKFGPIIEDKRVMQDILLVVTFDESEKLWGTNQVYTVMVGGTVVPGTVIDQPHHHYSFLRLMEENFGLGTLGLFDQSAPEIFQH